MAEPFTTYKLIVLYMAKHSKETLTNSQISEFILDRDYTDYFQLQKVLSELVETELLRKRTISNSSYYEITEEGKKTLSYFEKELSGEIKNEVKDYLQTHGGQVQERILTPADYYTTPQGNYAVRCQIIEKDTTTMHGSEHWQHRAGKPHRRCATAGLTKSQDIYGMLMGELIS